MVLNFFFVNRSERFEIKTNYIDVKQIFQTGQCIQNDLFAGYILCAFLFISTEIHIIVTHSFHVKVTQYRQMNDQDKLISVNFIDNKSICISLKIKQEVINGYFFLIKNNDIIIE